MRRLGVVTTVPISACRTTGDIRFLASCDDPINDTSDSRARASLCRNRYGGASLTIGVSFAIWFASPVLVIGGEPLHAIRDAWVASSSELRSGSGKGMYRCYEAVGTGEWKLTVDAEITTHFAGRNYYIELVYYPENRGIKCRRFMKNERSLRTAWFSPGWVSHGQIREIKPENHGDGLARPSAADFAWDVSKLSMNIWNADEVIKRVARERIKVVETSEGDLMGSYPRNGDDRFQVHFECPKRFGFNLAKLEFTGPGDDRPSSGYQIEWKHAETGEWYIRSLQQDWQIRDEMKRMRDILKYTDFKPNAKVDPDIFTAEFLRMPMKPETPDKRAGREGR